MYNFKSFNSICELHRKESLSDVHIYIYSNYSKFIPKSG